MAHHKPQHLSALDRANEVRRRRYIIRRQVRARRLDVRALFTEHGLPAEDRALLAKQEVGELLTWGYRIGDTVRKRVLENTGDPSAGRKALARSTKLRALSPTRRDALLEALAATAPDACVGAATLEQLLADHRVRSIDQLEAKLNAQEPAAA